MEFKERLIDLGRGNESRVISQITDEDFIPQWDQTEEIVDKIVRFGEINERYAFRVFLMLERLPPHISKDARRPYAEHPDFHNAEYFPYILWSGNGDGPEIIQARDRYGRFMIEADDYPSYILRQDTYQISRRLYEMKDFVSIDKDFLRRFLDDETTGQELFQGLKYWISYHADLEEWAVSMTALWIMATYFYETFFAFPYLRINAEWGSGKSQVLKTIALTAFMGQYIADPSEAALFRGVDALHCVLSIDEAENLKEDDEKNLIAHLNTGYEYGSQVWRYNMNSMAIDRFQSYAPKALAAINRMSPILESRCLKVPILRSKEPEKYSDRNPFGLKEKVFDEIREHLLFWSIRSGPEYVRLDNTQVIERYKHLFKGKPPRVMQIMLPVLKTYEFLGLDTPRPGSGEAPETANLKKMIEYQGEQHITGGVNDSDQRILCALYKVAATKPQINTKNIIENIELDTEEEVKYYTPHKVGKTLSKYDISSRTVNGRKEYMPGLTREARMSMLEDILERYSICVTDIEVSEPTQRSFDEEEY